MAGVCGGAGGSARAARASASCVESPVRLTLADKRTSSLVAGYGASAIRGSPSPSQRFAEPLRTVPLDRPSREVVEGKGTGVPSRSLTACSCV